MRGYNVEEEVLGPESSTLREPVSDTPRLRPQVNYYSCLSFFLFFSRRITK